MTPWAGEPSARVGLGLLATCPTLLLALLQC
jgi:hypothetical protein